MINIPKSIGKIFEQNWKASCPDWLFLYKPPDAAQSFNMTDKLRFSHCSPCDYMMFDGTRGIFYTIELKTFDGSCSFERIKSDKGIIHYYQIESLKKFNNYSKLISGFILDFRKSNNTYFLSISDFCKMVEKINKKSFSENDMNTLCNPILIGKRKLKVNYKYDIENFLNKSYEIFVQGEYANAGKIATS